MKISIREIPVTISAFSMGMFARPSQKVRQRRFMPFNAIQAAVPIKVAIKADKNAIIRVLDNACII